MRRSLLAAALLAVLALVAAGCSSDFGSPSSVSEQGEDFLSVWRVFVVIALLVVALIWGLVLFMVIRYRRRSDRVPSQRQYNVPLEVVYTVIPLLIVGALFGLSAVNEERISDVSPDPDLVVEVVGFQWNWEFTYEDEGIRVTGLPDAPAVLRLPVGETVRFRLVSADVIHSFWVPRFLTKRDLIPGIDNEIDIDVIEEGRWTGRCAEYCGLGHGAMTFWVEAMSRDEFDEWVDEARSGESGDPTIIVEAAIGEGDE